jgi:outer membrane biosynthesis protein TonB
MRAYFFWKSSNKSLTFGFAFRPTAAPKFFDPRDRRFRTFVTLTLSLLLHAIILWLLLRYVLLSQGGPSGATDTTLNVTLASPPKAAAPPSPPTPVAPPETEPTPPRPQPEEPRPRRNILTAPGSKTRVPQESSLPPLPPPPNTSQPPQPDLSSMIAQRREQRAAQEAQDSAAASGPPSETEDEHARRIIAQNLQSAKGKEYQPGDGGIFEIRDRSLHTANLIFNGWDANVGRKFPRSFPISQGNSPSLDSAIIDKVIEIIRETHPTEFQWDSRRLGRTVTRSARKEDTEDLRAFLAAEFAYDDKLQANDESGAPPPRRRRGG